MGLEKTDQFHLVIDEIAGLAWTSLSRAALIRATWAYYYFSVQFRESLEIACSLHPDDEGLRDLRAGECDTSNLSPFAGIAAPGERMNHDEFMRRTLALSELDQADRARLEQEGQAYLVAIRSLPAISCALSICTYEDGGLEAVFRAILRAPDWDHPSLLAFRHFLTEHIRFDSDLENGHGAMCRHLVPDDRVLPLWEGFRDLLVRAEPTLAMNSTEVFATPAVPAEFARREVAVNA